jgi:uncharacterized membrane protein
MKPRMKPRDSNTNQAARTLAIVCWFLLIALCILWEILLAPLRPGGSWLVLKVVPLLFALPGMLRKSVYTLQWASLLVLLYFTEGVVRAASDAGVSRWYAGAEVILSVVFFMAAMIYLRPIKRAAKLASAKHAE